VRFYLGTHETSWLTRPDTIAPLFIAYSRFRRRVTPFPRPAFVRYCIDSNGFTQLSTYGRWTIPPRQYITDVIRYADELGPPDWAASQDHMCEPIVLAKTGSTIRDHLERTVANHLELLHLWREETDRPCPLIPAVQGWQVPDYLLCLRMYAEAGIDLRTYPAVGVGSVCRREDSEEIHEVIGEISVAAPGVKLHGFGVKTGGIRRYGYLLTSSDSLAWSDGARKGKIRLPGCTTHKNCANCHTYAMGRYRKVDEIARIVTSGAYRPRPRQLAIFDAQPEMGPAS
jgi:hypothetical protein